MCGVTKDLAGFFLLVVFSSKPETPHPAGEEWVAKCFEACDSCVSLQTGREPASPCPSKQDKIVLKISHKDRPHITTKGPVIARHIYLVVNPPFRKSEDAFQHDWERAALTLHKTSFSVNQEYLFPSVNIVSTPHCKNSYTRLYKLYRIGRMLVTAEAQEWVPGGLSN